MTTKSMLSDDFYAVCHEVARLSGGGKTAYIHKLVSNNSIRRTTSYFGSYDRECIIGAVGQDVALLAVYRDGLCKRWFGEKAD